MTGLEGWQLPPSDLGASANEENQEVVVAYDEKGSRGPPWAT